MHVKPVALSSRKNERGQALAFFGIGMLAFVALAVIGVDVGRLAFTAAEVQSIADAAATAGAGALADLRPDPLGDATKVVGQNYVDARTGTVGGNTTDVIKSITPGVWDFTARTFTASSWTDPTANAVRARGVATVENLVAAAIGVVTSDVERQATAVAGGACTEVGALPIAIEQDAIQQFLDAPDCRNIPVTRLYQVPFDNSCWTSLSSAATNTTSVQNHIPAACQGSGNGNVGGGQTAVVSVGQSIDLSNGQLASSLGVIAGCLTANPPQSEFIVPVVGDGQCGSHASNIVSFARIIIDHVQSTGSASTKGVYIKGVCREELTGTNPGCNTAGENAVAIVK